MDSTNFIFSIGIDVYKSKFRKNLNNAVLDARELTNTLVDKYSFEEYPTNLYNESATRANIFTAFCSLNQSVTENDSVVIFFAGHGNMDPHSNRGFWIPFEGTNDRSTWIENSVIKDFINDCPAKHVLLIIDSCFSGTFLTNTRNVNLERSYLDLKSKKSRWVICSGGKEKVSDGIDKEHSPFCKLILRFLKKNENKNFSVSEIFNYIHLLIKKDTKQTPQSNIISNIGHEDGELVFTVNNDDFNYNHVKTIGIPNSENLKKEYLSNIESENKLSVGKEILILNSFVDGVDYLITENFRFNENNEKRILFKDGLSIIDIHDSSKSLEVIRRFATWSGLLNYIDSNEGTISEKTVIIRAHSDIENVEENLYSKYYSQYLNQLLELNNNKMHCLHCGEKISNNESYLIEFDDLNLNVNVGNVHKNCLRSIDRILGKSIYGDINNKDRHLINFDFDKWITLYEIGQGQIKGILRQNLSKRIYTISWNPENNINKGNYCITMNYDNGDTSFVMCGKQIQRFTDDEIDEWLVNFNGSIDQGKPCKIIGSGIGGYFNFIEKILEQGSIVSFVTSYCKTRYSMLYEEYNILEIDDYTPLCYFSSFDDNIFCIDNNIPLLSNPEQIENFIDNWEMILAREVKIKTNIIESDLELGNLISLYKQQNKVLVVNPIYNILSKVLESGFQFVSLEDIIQSKQSNSHIFNKGDKVNVSITTKSNANILKFGILLKDQFLDETGEYCSIFQPIEEGRLLKFFYKIPIKLMKKC